MPQEPMTLSALRETEDEVTEALQSVTSSESEPAKAEAAVPESTATLTGEIVASEPIPESPPPERKLTLAERFRSMKEGMGS
jgi:hypothetical protein